MRGTLRTLLKTATLGLTILAFSHTGTEAQTKKVKKSSSSGVRSVSYGGARSASGIEKSLLGIRILQSYKQVLARYGQPTRIYRLGETLEFNYEADANGKYTGGVLGLLDTNSTTGGPGGGGGRQGGGPPAGYGPPGGGGGPPAGYGGPGGGYQPGGGRQGGPPAGYGAPGGGGPSGAEGGLSGAAQEDLTFKASGGYIWVYVYPDRRATAFLFNADGRCEVVLELGRFNGQPTSRGITLGSPIADVYRVYGWPESSEYSATGVSLYYNNKYHLQIEVVNNKVSGILVCLREEQKYKIAKDANGGGGGGRGGAGGGGRPGGAGGGGKGGAAGAGSD